MARPRSEEARQKILTATAQLAREVGIRSLTIDEVARRSGVAKTTIYRHFPTKNQLIVTALDGITPVPAVANTGNVHDDLVSFLGEVLPIFASAELRVLYLEVMAMTELDEELAQLQRTMMAGRGQALTSIVRRAIDRGELPSDLPLEVAFELIEGPLAFRALAHPNQFDPPDLHRLVSRILAALRA